MTEPASTDRRSSALSLFRPAALIATALALSLVLFLLMIGSEGGIGDPRLDRPHPWVLPEPGVPVDGESAHSPEPAGRTMPRP